MICWAATSQNSDVTLGPNPGPIPCGISQYQERNDTVFFWSLVQFLFLPPLSHSWRFPPHTRFLFPIFSLSLIPLTSYSSPFQFIFPITLGFSKLFFLTRYVLSKGNWIIGGNWNLQDLIIANCYMKFH